MAGNIISIAAAAASIVERRASSPALIVEMTRHRVQRWRDRDRLLSAVSAILINGMIGYTLLVGLASSSLNHTEQDESRLTLFDVRPPPPPEERRPEAQPAKKQGGGGSEPAPRKVAPHPPPRPTTIVAPPPVIAIPNPPLRAVTPVGSSDQGQGQGEGAGGGEGGGAGSGDGRGDGEGDGDGGSYSSARQIGGRFRNSDFPDSARGAGRLKIGVRYAIGPSGRVDRCEIIEGSGYADVDAMTCRIITERYRFRPARDPDGYAVTEVREEDYRWRVR